MGKKPGTYWRGCGSVPKGASQFDLEMWAETNAQKLLALMWDGARHSSRELVKVAGHRFGSSVHILRNRHGWRIKTEADEDTGKFDYWLESFVPNPPTQPKVRLYLPWADVEALTHGTITEEVQNAAEEAIE